MVQLIDMDSDLFNQEVKEKRCRAVIGFTAEWCEQCDPFTENLKTCAERFSNFTFFMIDIDMHEDLAGQNEIAGIPSVLIFEQGEERHKLTGKEARENLESILSDWKEADD